jgi:hypothetical protein
MMIGERSRQRMQRFSVVGTILGAVVSLASALAMRDSVRLVDILSLFFGGMGTGAGLASLAATRMRSRSADPAA